MPTVTYLIGQPGAGKSTAMAAAVALLGLSADTMAKPFAHAVLRDAAGRLVAVELGKARPPFSGTDTLSMSVQPKVLEFLEQGPAARVWGEGDRLANGKFFDAVQALGWQLRLVHLAIDDAVAAERRARRAAAAGLPAQNPEWLRGRLTKVQKLSVRATHTVDAGESPEQVAKRLAELLMV